MNRGAIQVLLVEDDESLNELISGDLRDSGYEIMSACSGREAFEKIKLQQPNVLLC